MLASNFVLVLSFCLQSSLIISIKFLNLHVLFNSAKSFGDIPYMWMARRTCGGFAQYKLLQMWLRRSPWSHSWVLVKAVQDGYFVAGNAGIDDETFFRPCDIAPNCVLENQTLRAVDQLL